MSASESPLGPDSASAASGIALKQPTGGVMNPADSAELAFSLDHVGIDVDDLPGQVDFYRRAFDLKVEGQADVPEYNFTSAMLASPTGWHLELFKRDGAAPRPIPDDVDGQHNVLGVGHVCFAVSGLEEAVA